jgi:hypothetical protein
VLDWRGIRVTSLHRQCQSYNDSVAELGPVVQLRTSHARVGQEQINGLAAEAIKRIDLCLARRTSAEKVVFVFDMMGPCARANTDLYFEIRRHYSLSSNLQFENGPSLAVEWYACAGSIDAVAFLLGGMKDVRLNDGRPLAWSQSLHALDLRDDAVSDESALASCQALHTLNLCRTQVRDVSALASWEALCTLILSYTQVSDVSPLASCQALHTLNLDGTQVRDVSALASCQALHTLYLGGTQVSDVSALASCQALHTLYLGGTQVSDVSALASCQALHTLNLCHTQVSDVSPLAPCQTLHTLNLGGTQVSDVCLRWHRAQLYTHCTSAAPK